MSLIFVDTDKKLYSGAKAGKSQAKAEAKMQEVVKRIIDKTSGFTTTKSDNAKGYTIMLGVSKVEIAGNKTKCSLTGEIRGYPGGHMISTSMNGNGAIDGTSEGSLLDCVESVAEALVTKSVPIMRNYYPMLEK